MTAVVGTVSSILACFAGQAVLAGEGLEGHLADPGALRSVIGAGVYMTVLALVALGLGTLIRSVAATIATVVALVFVLPGVANALPAAWQNAIVPYFRPTPARRSSANQVRTILAAPVVSTRLRGGVRVCSRRTRRGRGNLDRARHAIGG